MPVYQFKNTETDEVFEDILSIAKKEELLEKNPHIHQVPTGFTIVGGVGDNMDAKTPDGFKEVLAKIGEKYDDSPLADRYTKNKSNKQIKAREIVKNHWKNQ